MKIVYENKNTGWLTAYDVDENPVRGGKSLGEVEIFGQNTFRWSFKSPATTERVEWVHGECSTFGEALTELHGRIMIEYGAKSSTWVV